MKRAVMITFVVEASEYEGVPDTPEGVLDLVSAMFDEEADFPAEMTVSCNGVRRVFPEFNR